MKKPQLSEMTLREKIGQTALMETALLMQVENLGEFLKENPIGNVWHACNEGIGGGNMITPPFDDPRDTEFYRNWTKQFDKASKIPALFALDGPEPSIATDIPQIVSAPLVGATNSEEMAYEYGKLRALTAKTVGANWVWSPVVDLPHRLSISTMRGLSDIPEKVCRLSEAFMKGMQGAGVSACAKHFPGKDRVEYRNAHFAPVFVRGTMEEWKENQGAMFQHMIDKGVWSILPGHEGFPACDDRKIGKTYIPATVSEKILTKLLKEEMGFEGVIITDAVDMASLKVLYPEHEDLYVACLAAGNDVILKVEALDYIDMIERAVMDGRLSEERIDDACRRVLDLKEKLGLFEGNRQDYPMTKELKDAVNDFNKRASEAAITLESDLNGKLPLDPKKFKKVAVVVTSYKNAAIKPLEYLKEAFMGYGIEADVIEPPMSNEEMAKIDENYDLIVYASWHGPGGVFQGDTMCSFFYSMTKGMEKSIGVTFGSVFLYKDYYENLDPFVHAYSLSQGSQQAFVDAIFGKIPFKGEMPFMLDF